MSQVTNTPSATLDGGPNRIFVYGTLKEGEWGHRNLLGAKKICAGVSTYGVMTFSGGLGTFPYLYPEEVCRVYGEIYEINETILRNLDRYEGVGSGHYRRVVADTGLGQAWIYICGEDRDFKDEDLVIEYGRWSGSARAVRYVTLRQHFEDQAAMMEKWKGDGLPATTGNPKIVVPESWKATTPVSIKEVRAAVAIELDVPTLE